MENYDEKMNYSFEPAPEEPSRPPLEQAKEEIRRSGKHTRLKIAALLAAVLPNPIRYRADAPSGYVRSRQAWILRQMRQLGGEGFMRNHQLR